jgi:hypothetical protein
MPQWELSRGFLLSPPVLFRREGEILRIYFFLCINGFSTLRQRRGEERDGRILVLLSLSSGCVRNNFGSLAWDIDIAYRTTSRMTLLPGQDVKLLGVWSLLGEEKGREGGRQKI